MNEAILLAEALLKQCLVALVDVAKPLAQMAVVTVGRQRRAFSNSGDGMSSICHRVRLGRAQPAAKKNAKPSGPERMWDLHCVLHQAGMRSLGVQDSGEKLDSLSLQIHHFYLHLHNDLLLQASAEQ